MKYWRKKRVNNIFLESIHIIIPSAFMAVFIVFIILFGMKER